MRDTLLHIQISITKYTWNYDLLCLRTTILWRRIEVKRVLEIKKAPNISERSLKFIELLIIQERTHQLR